MTLALGPRGDRQPTLTPAEGAWRLRPLDAPLRLRDGELHVWYLDLDALADAELTACLSAIERARTERLRGERLRRRMGAARAALRHLVGAATGVEAAAVSLAHGPFGKPRLADAEAGVEFNLAHSGARALVALNATWPVGVDLEPLADADDLLEIAERVFSPAERAALADRPSAGQAAAFTRCWTRKEAYVKALGTGFGTPLDSFDVELAPGARARLLAIDGDRERAREWTLLDVSPGDGWYGAVAVRGAVTGVHRWTPDPDHREGHRHD